LIFDNESLQNSPSINSFVTFLLLFAVAIIFFFELELVLSESMGKRWCQCCSAERQDSEDDGGRNRKQVRNRRRVGMDGCKWVQPRTGIIVGVIILILVIVIAVTLSVTLAKSPEERPAITPLKWWQNASVYRIYVASFADADGDGIGDFKGIENHLDYLNDLGVDVLWLSPVQNTNTFGLDVIDFDQPKSEFGSEQDFKDLMNATKSMGMKVIMDIIMNQSGSVHKWFIQSRDGIQPYNDYYVWNKGKSGYSTIPPNNWMSVYSGSAWQWYQDRQEYLLHQFWKTEPDLNYANPNIIQEMSKVAEYWLGLGIDGFYLRDVAFLYEDAQFQDEPMALSPTPSDDYLSLSHNYTRDLSESFQVVGQIFSAVIAEQTLDQNQEKILMVAAGDRLMSDGSFMQMYKMGTTDALNRLESIFTGVQLKTAIEQVLSTFNHTQVWPTWTLGNEERHRILSKFERLSTGLQVVQLLLPGAAVVYYGEEIQMKNHPFISFDETVDVVAKAAGPDNYLKVSRDPFRTPMQWNNSRNAGFTAAKIPWLPLNYNDQNVKSQMNVAKSLWNTIRQLGQLKKSSLALLNGTIDFPLISDAIFSFTRIHVSDGRGYLIVWNVGDQPQSCSFDNTTYIAAEMSVIRKIKAEGSQIDFPPVNKNKVDLDAKEIGVYSFAVQGR